MRQTAPNLPAALRHLARELDGRTLPPAERGFAAGVADRLAHGPFTYTDRAALLSAGRRLGIGHARANLIIALKQNGVPPVPVATQSRPTWGSAVLAAMAVQTAVVTAGLWAWLA